MLRRFWSFQSFHALHGITNGSKTTHTKKKIAIADGKGVLFFKAGTATTISHKLL